MTDDYERLGQTFYYASSYHLPGIPGAGALVAERAIPRIEALTGWKCTAKWPFDFRHGEPWYAKKAAEADFQSVKDADVVLFLPLTKTSRGTHVELGMAIALNKRRFGWRFDATDDGTAFDAFCERLPHAICQIVEEETARVRAENDDNEPRQPAPMPKVGA